MEALAPLNYLPPGTGELVPEDSPAGVCGSEKWPWLSRDLGSRCGLGSEGEG